MQKIKKVEEISIKKQNKLRGGNNYCARCSCWGSASTQITKELGGEIDQMGQSK